MSDLRPSILALIIAILSTPAQSYSSEPDSQEELMSLVKLVNSQVMMCWLPNMKKPEIVVLDIHLNRDGTLDQPAQLDLTSISTNLPSPDSVAAAMRAVEHCAPFKLPANQYENWRDLKLTFKPPPPLN